MNSEKNSFFARSSNQQGQFSVFWLTAVRFFVLLPRCCLWVGVVRKKDFLGSLFRVVGIQQQWRLLIVTSKKVLLLLFGSQSTATQWMHFFLLILSPPLEVFMSRRKISSINQRRIFFFFFFLCLPWGKCWLFPEQNGSLSFPLLSWRMGMHHWVSESLFWSIHSASWFFLWGTHNNIAWGKTGKEKNE